MEEPQTCLGHPLESQMINQTRVPNLDLSPTLIKLFVSVKSEKSSSLTVEIGRRLTVFSIVSNQAQSQRFIDFAAHGSPLD